MLGMFNTLGKAGAYPCEVPYSTPHCDYAPSLARIGWKWLVPTDSLDYNNTELMTVVKSFVTLAARLFVKCQLSTLAVERERENSTTHFSTLG